jgi:hypothetical protein
MIRAGLRVKAISFASQVIYWDAQWIMPPGAPRDGYFAVSLAL